MKCPVMVKQSIIRATGMGSFVKGIVAGLILVSFSSAAAMASALAAPISSLAVARALAASSLAYSAAVWTS